jgi:hypothetical protein
MPEAGRPREQVEIHGRACTHVLFLCKAELGFFHFLEIVTGWLVPSASQKIPVQPGWYLQLQKIRPAENTFLQAGKGAENTKEEFRLCFMVHGGRMGLKYRVKEPHGGYSRIKAWPTAIAQGWAQEYRKSLLHGVPSQM